MLLQNNSCQGSIHTYLIDHSPLGLFRANETNNWNELKRLRIPNGRGRPVGYVQAQPRSWTRDYLEQIQLVVRAGLELGLSRFQVLRPNHSPTLPLQGLRRTPKSVFRKWQLSVRWKPAMHHDRVTWFISPNLLLYEVSAVFCICLIFLNIQLSNRYFRFFDVLCDVLLGTRNRLKVYLGYQTY